MEWSPHQWKGEKMAKREILKGEIFECGFCNGSGTLPGSKGIKCPVCKGKGIVRVQPPAIACAYCNGSGRVSPRTNITCTVCKGKGAVTIQEPFEVCANCKGTGTEFTSKLPCLVCKGKGVVTVKEQ